jgi:hypothetical protein
MSTIRLSSKHKTHEQLHKELEEAKNKVKVGGIYSHYKYPENTYEVLNLGFREATDEVCVIYQATYNKQLIFIREVKSWLESPELNGVRVPRFKLLN